MSVERKQKAAETPGEASELEKLVEEKMRLWAEIRDDPARHKTEQYKRIKEIDLRLWELA